MKRPTLNPFRRLQWRLTFSYTLVTTGALVVVELFLFAALLLLLNSNFLINSLLTTLKDSVSPQLSPFLQSSPPDLAGLNNWLAPLSEGNAIAEQSYPRLTRGLSISVDQEGSDIYILDTNGRVLAQAASSANEAGLGQALNIPSFPQFSELLPAALAGDEDLDHLHTVSPDGMLLLALPITGQEEAVLGVFAMALPLPALNSETMGAIITVVLYSVIPFTLAAVVIGTVFGFLTARGLTRRLHLLSRAAHAWSQADFSITNQDDSGDELGQLSRHLNRMAEQLQNLMQTRQELAALEERTHLARELHDSVKQQVFATTMQIGAAKARLSSDMEAAQHHLEEAEQLSRQSQKELVNLIAELRPAALQGQGLIGALQEFTAAWSRRTIIPVHLRISVDRSIPLTLELALFRVAQEALANVARHSQAHSVDMELAWTNDQLTLTIHDDGQGFELADGEQHGFGTQTMRQRMAEVGGELTLESTPGSGTTVIARINSLVVA
jgi:NarL family two-component system sensor histidine kinase LiaS